MSVALSSPATMSSPPHARFSGAVRQRRDLYFRRPAGRTIDDHHKQQHAGHDGEPPGNEHRHEAGAVAESHARDADREHDRTDHADDRLTRRETQILSLLAAGQRQKEIACELSISPKTVATHVQNLLGKFGVNSRAVLVARAYLLGLVDGGER